MADTLAQRQLQLGKLIMAGYPKLGLPGFPMAAACAVVGNATQENICLPTTPGTKDHGSDGVFQWRQGRLTEMKAWCVVKFSVWNTLEAQAAFMMYECKRDYADLYKDLLAGTKTIPTLTADFSNIYERPAQASAMIDNRIKYAEDAHALLAGVAPPAPISAATKTAGGMVITTAGAAAAAQASGLPHWTTAAILGSGALLILILAAREAFKKATVPVAQEPPK